MKNSWQTRLQGDLIPALFVWWEILLCIVIPNHNIALKLPLMVVNIPPLSYVLTRFLTFAIIYAILVYLSRWSPSCLPLNSNVDIIFSIIISLGNPNQWSSLCTWMVIRILLTLWPRDANITPIFPSWSLLYSGVIWTFSKSKFFTRGINTVSQHPLSIKIWALLLSPSMLTYGIS